MKSAFGAAPLNALLAHSYHEAAREAGLV